MIVLAVIINNIIFYYYNVIRISYTQISNQKHITLYIIFLRAPSTWNENSRPCDAFDNHDDIRSSSRHN